MYLIDNRTRAMSFAVHRRHRQQREPGPAGFRHEVQREARTNQPERQL